MLLDGRGRRRAARPSSSSTCSSCCSSSPATRPRATSISGGMLALIEHPTERAKLLAEPALLPTAVEEMLRWVLAGDATSAAPRRATPRSRGQKIRRATRSSCSTRRRTATRTCSPTRTRSTSRARPNDHVAFGIGGPHFCLGANLARARDPRDVRGAARAACPTSSSPGPVRAAALQLHQRAAPHAGALPRALTPRRETLRWRTSPTATRACSSTCSAAPRNASRTPSSNVGPSGTPDAPVEPAEPSAEQLAHAERLPAELRLGTSSWSFPGWKGIVYGEGATQARLARSGLAAYARHPLLRTVGLDRTYYARTPDRGLRALRRTGAARLPLPRESAGGADHRALSDARALRRRCAGRDNATFLDASWAEDTLVGPACDGLGDALGVILFQLPPQPAWALGGRERFAERLARFLGALPVGPVYAVELRTEKLLGDAYAQALDSAGAAHCFNVHPTMPDVALQAATIDPSRGRRWSSAGCSAATSATRPRASATARSTRSSTRIPARARDRRAVRGRRAARTSRVLRDQQQGRGLGAAVRVPARGGDRHASALTPGGRTPAGAVARIARSKARCASSRISSCADERSAASPFAATHDVPSGARSQQPR